MAKTPEHARRGSGVRRPLLEDDFMESLRREVLAEAAANGKTTTTDLKTIVINKSLQAIGMGRYQWTLFVLCGFGWFSDNLWLQGVALTLPSLSKEFGIPEERVRYTTCALFIGLSLGATFWGFASDIIGRRPVYYSALFFAGAFGLAAGTAPNWITVCASYAALGTGVGGSLPVDGALLLEFLPQKSGGVLTLLSMWWPLGQVVASLLAWGFLGGIFADDKGWRYFVYTMGAMTAIMWFIRCFCFKIYESPKLYLKKDAQTWAVDAIGGVADINGTTTWLTEEILDDIGKHGVVDEDEDPVSGFFQ